MTWRTDPEFSMVRFEPVALGNLPAASAANTGAVAFTTDGIGGSAGLVVSNGTNWVYVADGSTTAATS